MPSKIALKSATTSTSTSRERFRKALVACGPISALIYVGWAELAALRWSDYSRITNAISELSLPESPSAGFLQPWEFIAYHAFVIAFGIGVWQSAGRSRSLRVVGGLQVLAGATFPLWLAFGEVLAAHMVLSTVAVLAWLGSLGFGAAAFDKRFQLYSLITLAAVLVFNAMAFMYVPEAAAGEAMGVIGLYERVAFSAYFMWVMVLAVTLWPQAAGSHRDAHPDVSGGAPMLHRGMTRTISDASGHRQGTTERCERRTRMPHLPT
jgi:hypothetical protein